MPNHCSQTVTITGPSVLVHALSRAVKEGNFCQLVMPMPFSEQANWYNWHTDNWNTKWDICEPEITNASWNVNSHWLLAENKEKLSSFTFTCWTAWSPPIPIWEILVEEHGMQVEASYIDEGGFFAGRFKNGDITEWEPTEHDMEAMDA